MCTCRNRSSLQWKLQQPVMIESCLNSWMRCLWLMKGIYIIRMHLHWKKVVLHNLALKRSNRTFCAEIDQASVAHSVAPYRRKLNVTFSSIKLHVRDKAVSELIMSTNTRRKGNSPCYSGIIWAVSPTTTKITWRIHSPAMELMYSLLGKLGLTARLKFAHLKWRLGT